MLRDVEYFKTKIGGLDGAGDTADFLIKLVKGKTVPKAKEPVPEVTPQSEKTGTVNEKSNGVGVGVEKSEPNGKDTKENETKEEKVS